MPRFEPFRALRYTASAAGNAPAQKAGAVPIDVSSLTSPPYDVISEAGRAALERRDPRNSVRIDFPHSEQGVDGYDLAAQRLREWAAQGALEVDRTATYTRYRMTAPGVDGKAVVTLGVIGALGLEPPGTGDVLPHEQTTPKDKADRLSLLRATELNTSPIWGLSLTRGLGAVLATDEPPHYRAIDDDGVVHEAWVIRDESTIAAIRAHVECSPVVVADGHHRYETAHAYADERMASAAPAPKLSATPWDAAMALIVELAEDQLAVRPIHRIVEGLGPDAVATLSPWFDSIPAPTDLLDDPSVIERLIEAGALGLVTVGGIVLMRPRPGAFADTIHLDSERLAAAVAALTAGGDAVSVRYHHDIATVRDAAGAGAGAVGVLLRPVTVAQIEAVAHARDRMPPKSTFFWPKPRTGMVFRPHDPTRYAPHADGGAGGA